MKNLGIKAIRQAAHRYYRFLNPPALILLYHRVTQLNRDPQLLSVTPENFEGQMAFLKKYFNPISLETLVEDLKNGHVRRSSIVITFDDGYADNLHYAKPILEHYEIPATVYVTTGYVNSDEEFWWDELDRLLLSPGELPKELSLNISGIKQKWELGSDAYWSETDYKSTLNWNVLKKELPSKRHKLYISLSQLMRPLDGHTQVNIINTLREWAHLGTSGRKTHQILSSHDIMQLSHGDLIDIGAHSVNHAVLSQLSPEKQEAEILGSKFYLEKILGRPVSTFAYPFGTLNDYSQLTTNFVKSAGFSNACINFGKSIYNYDMLSPYQLPRFLVRNWDNNTFPGLVKKWVKS